MKDSYVEADFPRYFEFGVFPDGRVNLASPKDDTICVVTREEANKLLVDRDNVITRLCELARRFDEVAPDEFTKFWYPHWEAEND